MNAQVRIIGNLSEESIKWAAMKKGLDLNIATQENEARVFSASYPERYALVHIAFVTGEKHSDLAPMFEGHVFAHKNVQEEQGLTHWWVALHINLYDKKMSEIGLEKKATFESGGEVWA